MNDTKPFFYSAKASGAERNRGCEDLYWKYDGTKHIRITEQEFLDLANVEGGPRTLQGSIHSTVKPVEVMKWLIERHTKEGDVILDPFAGSGTTGVAAIMAGRDCKLVEMDEEDAYECIIRRRLYAAKEDALANLDVWEEKPEIQVPERDPEAKEEDPVDFADLFF